MIKMGKIVPPTETAALVKESLVGPGPFFVYGFPKSNDNLKYFEESIVAPKVRENLLKVHRRAWRRNSLTFP